MVQQRGAALQDPFLNILRRERVPVSVFLVNGIKLQGQIESFDQFVVLLRNSVSQMIYKHAISTIVPARNIRIPHDGRSDDYNKRSDDYGNTHSPQNPQSPQHGSHGSGSSSYSSHGSHSSHSAHNPQDSHSPQDSNTPHRSGDRQSY